MRLTYSPMSPRERSCTPEKKVTTRTVVERPGVRSTPMSFCTTYHAPMRKLKPATANPASDMSWSVVRRAEAHRCGPDARPLHDRSRRHLLLGRAAPLPRAHGRVREPHLRRGEAAPQVHHRPEGELRRATSAAERDGD